MRESRQRAGGRAVPETPEEFAAVQRQRLLRQADLPGTAGPRRRMDVALTGPATSAHEVRVSVLGPFLANLQESVSAVAQALTGRPTNAASIPRPIREMTALSASALFPSSFGVALYGPEREIPQDSLFPDLRGDLPTVLDDAVDTVLDVVDLSENTGRSDDRLAEQLVPLGQRAMKHLGALTAGLTDAELGLRLTWYAEGGRPRHSQWTPDGAQRVRYLCEHSEFQTPEVLSVTGWLGSASALRGTVEIRTDGGEIIRARTDEEITPRLGAYFGNRVEADVEVTTVRSAGGRERKNYAVVALRNA
ncbi:hypothetical protein G3I19_35115 [Streptomyces sp. SID10853]|uniref:hypothetical protein n=1 Tax=Streptomyces sp. SID10853 TaxID=2706028 RepID=UPI0013C0D872|nr:hypothetical protein [Streptomyces sp. SID10853]NDZ83653.1 hypothetical protein [Streptomyces sp. SID10853]